MHIKKQNIIQFISIVAIVILTNIIGSYAHFRIDLTKEGRYSLSNTTKELLIGLDDYIYVEVYLKGDFPAGIERLSKETEQILNEFKSVNDLIQYNFINPTESPDEKTRTEILQQLYEKGLTPTNLQVKEANSYTEKVIIPGAIIKYGANELPINLLKNIISSSPQENIERSIQELEYEFTNAIIQLITQVKPNIAFIEGHGELNGIEVEDFRNSLREQYNVKKIDLRTFEVDANGNPDLSKKLNEINQQKLLIIAKPINKFQNLDKYFIDQFIMNGGKTLWLMDATNADMDSLSNKGTFLATPLRELNLKDMLFKYGVRINSTIIEDVSSSKIPVPTSFLGDVPQWELRPWRYFPIIIPTLSHPITNNLNAVKFEFVGNIDTVNVSASIKKTVLLKSSPYTKLVNTPYEISLQEALNAPIQDKFNSKEQPLAVLLEGKFESVFKNRLAQLTTELPFKDSSVETKILVIADGDIARNTVSRGVALPLGYDNYEKKQYGNKNFLLNAVNYLLEENELIDIRNRDVKMRLLDAQKVSKEKPFWQFFNILLPVLIILILGWFKHTKRINKYTNET